MAPGLATSHLNFKMALCFIYCIFYPHFYPLLCFIFALLHKVLLVSRHLEVRISLLKCFI